METIGNKMYVHWSDITLLCRKIADDLQEHPDNFMGIVAVARGGLAPAGIITNYWTPHKPLPIDVMHISTRKVSGVQELKGTVLTLPGFQSSARILVIDDILDSGMTASIIRDQFPNAIFAALFVKPEAAKYAAYKGMDISQDVWVVFPWEIDNVEAKH